MTVTAATSPFPANGDWLAAQYWDPLCPDLPVTFPLSEVLARLAAVFPPPWAASRTWDERHPLGLMRWVLPLRFKILELGRGLLAVGRHRQLEEKLRDPHKFLDAFTEVSAGHILDRLGHSPTTYDPRGNNGRRAEWLAADVVCEAKRIAESETSRHLTTATIEAMNAAAAALGVVDTAQGAFVDFTIDERAVDVDSMRRSRTDASVERARALGEQLGGAARAELLSGRSEGTVTGAAGRVELAPKGGEPNVQISARGLSVDDTYEAGRICRKLADAIDQASGFDVPGIILLDARATSVSDATVPLLEQVLAGEDDTGIVGGIVLLHREFAQNAPASAAATLIPGARARDLSSLLGDAFGGSDASGFFWDPLRC